ncbi:MAG TPA: multicopper oxidase domain-containing protein, partial [Mycobacterium sp.]|nr:multicopper oxidase domain-containing protein [Mycobacterium sp.]
VQAGAHPLVASAEGKDQIAAAVLRAGTGAAPPVDAQPAELTGRVLRYADLKPADDAKPAARKPDTTFTFDLTGSESSYEWGINGKSFDELDPFDVQQGERVRVVFRNKSSMWHPMHLHGHTFALDGTGTRKDTVIVRPKESVAVSFDADNPGQWMLHCHNTYHLEAGMAAKLAYVR